MKKWPSIGVDKQRCGGGVGSLKEKLIRKASGKLRPLQKNDQAQPQQSKQ
jgi:hypothetical protein